MIGRVTVIVTDDYTLARVLAANHIARDGVGDDARIRESEVLRDNAAPSVRAEFDRRHRKTVGKYTRRNGRANSRIGLRSAYRSLLRPCSSKNFTSFATSCARSRGQMSSASSVSTTTKLSTPMAATN